MIKGYKAVSIFLVACFLLTGTSSPAKAGDPQKVPTKAFTPCATLDADTPGEPFSTNSSAVVTHKTFYWYMKNGCNCPQCRARRKQMRDQQEHLQNTFQP